MPRRPSAKPTRAALKSYTVSLQAMSDGQLRRERIRLGPKGEDAWELAVWRKEEGARIKPAWA